MKAAEAKARIALKNILFATDFSPAADAAAPIAIQIAQRYGAKIFGVHVNPFDNYTAAAPEAWASMTEARERENQEDAQRLTDQLKDANHEVLIGEGNVWEVISQESKDKDIDLIVVGTRGRTGLGKNVLGSVAEEILRKATCPVLTVGPRINLWSEEYAKMQEILYATDLSTDKPAAAPYAISLAQENQAHLVLLHVIEPSKAGELVDPPEVADWKERTLQKLVPEQAGLWCEPTFIVEEGPAAEKILDVAKRRHTALIVLGAKPAGWLSTHFNVGIIHKIVSEATCPVLTIRG